MLQVLSQLELICGLMVPVSLLPDECLWTLVPVTRSLIVYTWSDDGPQGASVIDTLAEPSFCLGENRAHTATGVHFCGQD